MSTAANRIASAERTAPEIAIFATRWLQPSTAVIAVHGEIDAANAGEFIDYVRLHIPHTDQLVLDLSAVEFFATAGFSAVHTVSVTAAAQDVDWMLVPSRAVNRLLRICDPDSALPICEDVDVALTRLQPSPSNNLLQLVAKAR